MVSRVSFSTLLPSDSEAWGLLLPHWGLLRGRKERQREKLPLLFRANTEGPSIRWGRCTKMRKMIQCSVKSLYYPSTLRNKPWAEGDLTTCPMSGLRWGGGSRIEKLVPCPSRGVFSSVEGRPTGQWHGGSQQESIRTAQGF